MSWLFNLHPKAEVTESLELGAFLRSWILNQKKGESCQTVTFYWKKKEKNINDRSVF
jgi:hypothetical protein